MTKGFVWLVGAVLLALFPQSGRAEEARLQAERPLIKFHLLPERPKVGEEATLFLQVESGFERNEVHLELLWNGVRLNSSSSTSSLWIASFPAFQEISPHLISANLYLRNSQEAKRLREALVAVEKEIVSLEQQIADEPLPERRALLEAALSQKLLYRERLEEEYENLKVFVKSESFSFFVEGDPSNTNFPVLQSLSPNVGSLAGGTLATISGDRFPEGATPTVLIGGVNASVVSFSSTEIQVVVPSFPTEGARDVEARFIGAGKNAILKNGYFVTSTNLVRNTRPVAGVVGYIKAPWPHPGQVSLDASSSYDNEQDSFAYEWKVLSSPKNSNVIPGSSLPAVPNPSFHADRRGVFVFELKIRETGTPESLVSLPVVATVEVN